MSGSALTRGAIIAGRYRLDELLGSGGMGVVWGATHTVTERAVALKFVRGPAHLQNELRQRFLREARAASAVQHPNVVDVLDVFELDDETPVMVMERLVGETLGERLARVQALSLEATAALLVPAVSAVSTAHARGIVHRDLKPDNIFIERASQGDERVKVLDFGIAKLTGAVSGKGMTETGTMLGTACYMAPEQALGEKDVDHRADIWALGVILFECLAGARPVDGDSIGQVLMRVMNSGIRPLGQAVGGLPLDVTELVDRMLQPERERRPDDLREVLAVLERHTSVRAPTSSSAGERAAGAHDPPGASVPPDVDVNAPTENVSSRPETAAGHAISGGAPRAAARTRPKRALIAVLTLALVSALAFILLRPSRIDSSRTAVNGSARAIASAPATLQARMLTTLPTENPIWDALLSPDGSRYVYSDESGVWLASVQGGAPRKLRHVKGAGALALMPDGRTIAILRQSGPTSLEIDLVPIDGGKGRVLAVGSAGGVLSAVGPSALQPSPDGRELALGISGGLLAVDVTSSRARLLTRVPTTQDVVSVAWSPDGSRLALITGAAEPDAGTELALVHSDGTGYRRLLADARLFSPRSGAGLVWRDERRLLFSRLNDVTEPPGSGLWELDVGDPTGGDAVPHQIFSWDRQFASSLTISRSASRVLAVLSRTQGDVFVGALRDAGRKLDSVTRLTLHDGDDRPSAWLQNGRVLFMSDRYGTWDVMAQGPGSADAELLADSKNWETWPSTLGRSVMFWRFDPAATPKRRRVELLRIDERGNERRVLEQPMESEIRREAAPPPVSLSVGCARPEKPVCMLGQSNGPSYVFRRIDPTTGSLDSPVYERTVKSARWEISPDGRSIAMVGLEIGGLVFVSLETGAAREIKLEPGMWQTVHWMPDGTALMLTGMNVRGHAYAIARADLDGKLDLLHTSETAWLTQALPSPDATRLAFGAVANERNVQLLEGI